MNQEAIVTVSTASTSTFLASVIIFNEPMYLYLAIMSGFVGLLTALNDLDEIKKLNYSFYTFFVSFKGAFIGFFSAPMMMLALVLFGNQIALKIGIEIRDTNIYLVALYWSISILFSRVISGKLFKILEKGGNNDK